LKIIEDGGAEAIVVQETLEPQDVVVALDPYVAVGMSKVKSYACLKSRTTKKEVKFLCSCM